MVGESRFLRDSPIEYVTSWLMLRTFGLSLCLTFTVMAVEWKLVWSDEFTSQGPPDESRWTAEIGYLRNGEIQYYTGNRMENVRQENGCMILECRREEFLTPDQGIASLTSGSVTTKGKADWTYGRFEIRARMPSGKGGWASLWLMGKADYEGKPWPACGEIDIAEHVGRIPEKIFGTIHYQKGGRHRQKAFFVDDFEPEVDFHVYTMDWNKRWITFRLDGKEYGSVDIKRAEENGWNPLAQPFYLTISFALGGSWGGESDLGDLPQQFQIDYVRIYQADGAQSLFKPSWDLGSSRSR